MRITHHWFARYGLAVVIAFAAIALRLALVPVMGYSIPYLTIFPAMAFIAVTVGVGPGVLATVVGVLLAEIFLMSPGSPIKFTPSFMIRLAIMLLTSFYIGWVSSRLRHALTRADVVVAAARTTEEALRASEERLRALYASMTEGLANHEIVYEDGEAVDYIITDVNPAYERITGLARSKAVGKKASELYGIGKPPYLEVYVRVATSSAPEHFEVYFPPMEKHLAISIFSPEKGKFATVFSDITERKQAENIQRQLTETLTQRLAELQTLMDVAPVGIAIGHDPEGQVITVNRLLSEWLNAPTGTNVSLNTPEEERQVTYQVLREGRPARVEELPIQYAALNAQGVRNDEFSIVRSDGRTIEMLANAEPLFDDQGHVRGSIATYIDITERKRAEEDLERSKQKLDEILASIQDDFYVLDRDWNFAYASRLFTSKIGKEPGDFVGKNIWEMFPKHVGTVFEENLREAMEKREIQRFEIGGKYTAAWYRMTVFPSADGITVLGTDITERKRAEEHVAYQARLLASVNDAIVGSDAQFRLNVWNATAESMYGWKAEEVLGRSGVELLRTEWPQKDADEMRRVIAETGRWRGEATQLRKDGTRIPVEVSSIVLRDKNDQITGYVSVNHDITERKQVEETLARQAEDLRRSNIELEQFAYVASHDLQEPLRIMSSYSQLLERRYKGRLDQDAEEFIAFIVDAAARMQKLITDLLTYSRTGHGGAEMVEVDCNKVIQQLVDSLAATIKSAGGQVTFDQLPVITAHESSMTQLFQNLIGNALKFRSEQPPCIHVSARQGDGEWVFSVSDNGIGFEPQYNQRIFMIFQRLHARDKYAGTGIGLSICKKIVENLGGRIWVESEPGRGSTFTFTVPI
jgi:PAS domain S-box-containing protein